MALETFQEGLADSSPEIEKTVERKSFQNV